MKIVFLVLLFVYVIAFFWIIWKCAANWRWYQLVFVAITFLLTIPLLPMTAVVLRSRVATSKQASDLQDRLERAEKEQKDWINGVPNDPQRDPGLLVMQGELRALNAEVGRVFRDLEVRDRGPNGVVLAPAAPAVAAPDGMPIDDVDPNAANPPPEIPTLAASSIVYAFAERVLAEGGAALPVAYLGEFRVAQTAADSFTIVPTSPLEPEQLRAANNSNRWALYELMPTDSHEAFVKADTVPDNERLFGEINSELVRSLLASSIPPQALEEYLRDGTSVLPDDRPETRWMRVEFTKKYELTVDAMEQRSAIDGGFFDGLGQAVDSRLQRADGDVVSFDVGDQLVVKSEAGQLLVGEGVVQVIDEYFVRPLNSYRLVLKSMRQQIDYLNSQAVNLRRQQAVLQDALTLTTEMQTTGQQRKLELEKDEAQVGKELAAITGYVNDMQAELSEMKQTMARLYRENLSGQRELASIQAAIRKAADQRAQAAVGG